MVTPVQGPTHFAAELGKGVAMGLHTLGPLKSLSMAQRRDLTVIANRETGKRTLLP